MKKILAAALFLYLLIGAAYAETVTDLYHVTVKVEGRDEASRLDALNRALRAALVKAGGNRGILGRAKIAYSLEQMSELEAMVERFEYRAENGVQSVAVRFVPTAVEKLLDKAGGAPWSSNRPLVLLWISVNGKKLVNEEATPQISQILRQRAEQRGLPVLFPLLDLDDLRSLPAQTVAGASSEQVMDAARRYAPNAVLSAYLLEQEGNWEAYWKLYQHDDVTPWKRGAATLEELLYEGIDTLTDTLSAQYARYSQAAAESFEIIVEGVKNFKNYARVQNYLNALDTVSSWRISGVEQSVLRVSLEVRGGAAGFAHSAGLEQVLGAAGRNAEGLMVYHLLP